MKPYRWEKDGYVLRSAAKVGVQAYYEHNFNPLSPEIAYLTGCKPYFSRKAVRNGDQYVDDILMAILEAEWRTNPV